MPELFKKGKMVPLPTSAIIPERDLDKTPILECRHLGIDFGGLKAVDDFNLIIGRTEIAGLIGPNGAGKTTVFNLLTKVYQPTRGIIMLDGYDTAGKTTEQINRMGIARTFQNIRLFDNLSVEDNVKIGLHNQEPYSALTGVLRLPKLDEPAAGMNPSETAELMEHIVKIRDTFQIAVLLIEHDMRLVMGICEGICVLNFGRVIAKGTSEEIQANPVVIEAYLGKKKEG